MPHLKIQTNLPIGKKSQQSLLRGASALVARELAKPADLVLVTLEPDAVMLFAGTDDPVAFLELVSVGLSAPRTKALSQDLCELVEEHLGIARDRVYFKFISGSRGMWGFKGEAL